ncbi:MAG: hypothetical protein R3C10_00075 [Pirellulales bacterium]
MLRLAAAGDIPADSPLGRKTELIRTRRLRVVAIIPAEGLGRFSLALSQTDPSCAFVPIATLQDLLEQPDRAPTRSSLPGAAENATDPDDPSFTQAEQALADALAPRRSPTTV